MSHKQSQIDSVMEVVTNVGTGFIISWAVFSWIVAPLYGFKTGGGESFLITCIFTITSVLRSYILRRLFNGRSVWTALKAAFA